MPTPGFAHSLFWQQQPGPSVGPDMLPLMGVGRGAVASLALLSEPSILTLFCIGLLLMTSDRVLSKVKEFAIRALVGEDNELLAFLNSKDGAVAKAALDQTAYHWGPKDSPMTESKILELSYADAQAKGCQLSGWQLRFVIYYWLGKRQGKW